MNDFLAAKNVPVEQLIHGSFVWNFVDLLCSCSCRSHLLSNESLDRSDQRREFLAKWLGQTVIYHLLIFPYISQKLKLMVFLRRKKPLLLKQLLVIPLNGLPASVLVVTICRAVCYFMPCDPLILRRKKNRSGGILAFFPGAMVACYACGYRKALREKYKLQEAPCGDFTTHLFCHPCAICQEYREIRERSNASPPSLIWTDTTAPTIQTMHPTEK